MLVTARRVVPLTLALLVTACDATKSSTPLSPQIAGPMAGVVIVAPAALQPANGAQVPDATQPITLMLKNASTNGPRPFQMRVQLAADGAFNTILLDLGSIAPATSGETPVPLPIRLPSGRTYFLRASAADGANASSWSGAVRFDVLLPIVIGTPTPVSPINGTRTTTLAPTLVVNNGTSSGPHGPLVYEFQASASSDFSAAASATVPESTSGQTSYVIPAALATNITVYWRARITDGTYTGAWSATGQFLTPLTPPAPPAPPAPKPGTVPCGPPYPSDGNAIVTCIAATYPDKLAAGISSDQRIANVDFLRDRIIEVGLCGGLNLGYNLKGGGPAISDDFVTQIINGVVHGFDIAYASKDTSTTLHLTWAEGTDPYYLKYPNGYTCGK